MSRTLTIEGNLKIERRFKGAKKLVAVNCAPPKPVTLGRIPRISKLMALAIRWEGLIGEGAVKDYAEIATLCRVSRARISQISGLTNLAPDLQEKLLFLPRITNGRDALTLKRLLPIATETGWSQQRKAWKSSCLTG